MEHMDDCGASAVVMIDKNTADTFVDNTACQRLNCCNRMCAPYQLAKYTAHMEHRFTENGGAWYARVEVDSPQELKQVRRRVSDRARTHSDTARTLTIATRDPAAHVFLSELIEGQWKADPRDLTYLEPTDAFDVLSDVLRPENVLSSPEVRATSSNRRGVCLICEQWWKAEHEHNGVKSSGTPICTHDESWKLPTRHHKANDPNRSVEPALYRVPYGLAVRFEREVEAQYGDEREELLEELENDTAWTTSSAESQLQKLVADVRQEGSEWYWEWQMQEVTDNDDKHEESR